MKKLLIALLFPCVAQGQQIDTVVFKFSNGNIKYLVARGGVGVSTDSLWVNHNGVRTLLSPVDLPVNNSTTTALNLKVNISDTSSMLTNYRNGLNGKLATNGSAAALTSFPTLNQNTTGTAAGLSAVLSFANGGISTSAATSATTGTMTVNMTTSMITITPTGACTFNGSGGVAGQIVTFLITTSGTTSFVLTWGTNFRKVGTLATGTTSARFFSVTFICINGTTWQEIARTAVQT